MEIPYAYPLKLDVGWGVVLCLYKARFSTRFRSRRDDGSGCHGNTHIKQTDERGIRNIVLMGSGEPLDNYSNVIKFLRLVNHPEGLNISYRNITLSTCGLVPKMKKLAQENIPITLSILSTHLMMN